MNSRIDIAIDSTAICSDFISADCSNRLRDISCFYTICYRHTDYTIYQSVVRREAALNVAEYVVIRSSV
jgi:hypothetical protein